MEGSIIWFLNGHIHPFIAHWWVYKAGNKWVKSGAADMGTTMPRMKYARMEETHSEPDAPTLINFQVQSHMFTYVALCCP